MEEALSVGDANGEGAHADFAERAVAGEDDCRRWVVRHGILHPRLEDADEVAVDKGGDALHSKVVINFSGPGVP